MKHTYASVNCFIVPNSAIPWTVAFQDPLSMGFPRQEYWSRLPFASPGDLTNPGIEPTTASLLADSLLSEVLEKPIFENWLQKSVILLVVFSELSWKFKFSVCLDILNSIFQNNIKSYPILRISSIPVAVSTFLQVFFELQKYCYTFPSSLYVMLIDVFLLTVLYLLL